MSGLLVELLTTGKAALGQLAKTLELLAGEQFFALTQLHVGLIGCQCLASTQHFSFGLIAACFERAGVHACQQLAFGYAVTFINQHLGQTPRNFGGDLHFRGFEPTVAHADAFRKSVVLGLPVTKPACCNQQSNQRNDEVMGNTVIR